MPSRYVAALSPSPPRSTPQRVVKNAPRDVTRRNAADSGLVQRVQVVPLGRDVPTTMEEMLLMQELAVPIDSLNFYGGIETSRRRAASKECGEVGGMFGFGAVGHEGEACRVSFPISSSQARLIDARSSRRKSYDDDGDENEVLVARGGAIVTKNNGAFVTVSTIEQHFRDAHKVALLGFRGWNTRQKKQQKKGDEGVGMGSGDRGGEGISKHGDVDTEAGLVPDAVGHPSSTNVITRQEDDRSLQGAVEADGPSPPFGAKMSSISQGTQMYGRVSSSLLLGPPHELPARPPCLAEVAARYRGYEDAPLSVWGVWFALAAVARFKRPVTRKRRFYAEVEARASQKKAAAAALRHRAVVNASGIEEDSPLNYSSPYISDEEHEGGLEHGHGAAPALTADLNRRYDFARNPQKASSQALRDAIAESTRDAKKRICASATARRNLSSIIPMKGEEERGRTRSHRPINEVRVCVPSPPPPPHLSILPRGISGGQNIIPCSPRNARPMPVVNGKVLGTDHRSSVPKTLKLKETKTKVVTNVFAPSVRDAAVEEARQTSQASETNRSVVVCVPPTTIEEESAPPVVVFGDLLFVDKDNTQKGTAHAGGKGKRNSEEEHAISGILLHSQPLEAEPKAAARAVVGGQEVPALCPLLLTEEMECEVNRAFNLEHKAPRSILPHEQPPSSAVTVVSFLDEDGALYEHKTEKKPRGQQTTVQTSAPQVTAHAANEVFREDRPSAAFDNPFTLDYYIAHRMTLTQGLASPRSHRALLTPRGSGTVPVQDGASPKFTKPDVKRPSHNTGRGDDGDSRRVSRVVPFGAATAVIVSSSSVSANASTRGSASGPASPLTSPSVRSRGSESGGLFAGRRAWGSLFGGESASASRSVAGSPLSVVASPTSTTNSQTPFSDVVNRAEYLKSRRARFIKASTTIVDLANSNDATTRARLQQQQTRGAANPKQGQGGGGLLVIGGSASGFLKESLVLHEDDLNVIKFPRAYVDSEHQPTITTTVSSTLKSPLRLVGSGDGTSLTPHPPVPEKVRSSSLSTSTARRGLQSDCVPAYPRDPATGMIDAHLSLESMKRARLAASQKSLERLSSKLLTTKSERDVTQPLRRDFLLGELDGVAGGASSSSSSRVQDGKSREQGSSKPFVGLGRTLNTMLGDADRYVTNCRRSKELEAVASVRRAWFTRFYEEVVARFEFTEALERVLWRLQEVVKKAHGRGDIGLGEVAAIFRESTDDDLSEIGVQFVLCHVAAAFSVSYNTFRELLEVRHIPYRLLGNGIFTFKHTLGN